MVDYTKPTGTVGTLRIRDEGDTVEFAIKGDPTLAIAQLPWRYQIGDVDAGWRSFYFQRGGAWQVLGVAPVIKTASVSLAIGFTDTNLGGPTVLTAQITREGEDSDDPDIELRGAIIQVGNEQKLAIPYVNVGGVWRRAEAWGKHTGEWKPAR